MNILLIGRPCGLMDAFVHKLQKENNKIFLLTDKKTRMKRPRNIFEMYEFDYSSESVKYVFDSVRPDRTVFFGAFDYTYPLTGNGRRDQSLRYISGLLNVLIACVDTNTRDFVYLSSSEVFESDSPSDITEDTEPSPISFRSLVLTQAEDAVLRHGESSEMTTTVVRLDNPYGIPKKRDDCRDFCTTACLRLLIDNKCEFNASKRFSGIYFTDCAEGLYKIVASDSRRYKTYHLTSSTPCDEGEIASIIAPGRNFDTDVGDKTIGIKRMVLDGGRAREEFGIEAICDYETSVAKVFLYLKKHLGAFLTPEEKAGRGLFAKLPTRTRRLLHVIAGVAENVVAFFLVFILDEKTFYSDYFSKLDFFLLYVLVFALVRGRLHAIFSAFLASVGYVVIQSVARGGFDVLIDYSTYVWMAQLFIVGMSVGHLKERLKLQAEDKDEEIEYLNVQLTEIEDIDESNRKIKHVLENRLVNYNESFGMLYDIISKIDAMDPGEVLFHTARTVSEIMHTGHVAVFRVTGDYARLFTATSDKARSLGKSIRYRDYALMSKAFEEKNVFVNRQLDETLPSMAVALGDDGEISFIIMLWGLMLEQLTLYQSNLLRVLGYIVTKSAKRADMYLSALEQTRFIDGTHIMSDEAYAQIVKIHTKASEDGITECAFIRLGSGGRDAAELDAMLKGAVRTTDYAGIDKNGNLSVLLTNTSRQESLIVQERLAERGFVILPPDEESGDDVK